MSLVIVWTLALSISIYEAATNRIPLTYEEFNGTALEYLIYEKRFFFNRTIWEMENRTVYLLDENCSPISVQVCQTFTGEFDSRVAYCSTFILCYIIPVLTMAYCYGAILDKFMNRKVVIGARNSAVFKTANRLQNAKKRHVTIIVIVISTYVVLWGPYLIYLLYIYFDDSSKMVNSSITNLLKFITYTSTIFNPVIYMVSTGLFSLESWAPPAITRFLKKIKVTMTVSSISEYISRRRSDG